MHSNPWFPFHTYELSDKIHKKIFCFHHAGGSASVYRPWTLVKDSLNVICVELPGKGTRYKESFVDDVQQLLPPLASSVLDICQNEDFLIFGHSMGSAIAFYLVNYLEQHWGISPEKLIVAGRQAPQDEDPGEFKSYMGDEALIKELEKYKATPKEILENKEMMKFILPQVRKDYKLNESLAYHGEKINVPLHLHSGTKDYGATKHIMERWKLVTTKNTSSMEFDGDHFFIHDSNKYLNFLNQYFR